jgi:hypothetical protein
MEINGLVGQAKEGQKTQAPKQIVLSSQFPTPTDFITDLWHQVICTPTGVSNTDQATRMVFSVNPILLLPSHFLFFPATLAAH